MLEQIVSSRTVQICDRSEADYFRPEFANRTQCALNFWLRDKPSDRQGLMCGQGLNFST